MVKFIITAREFPNYSNDYIRTTLQSMEILTYHLKHGLRTTNEGINQRNLKIGPMCQTKYASAVPKNLGVGVDFRPCSIGDFLTGRL